MYTKYLKFRIQLNETPFDKKVELFNEFKDDVKHTLWFSAFKSGGDVIVASHSEDTGELYEIYKFCSLNIKKVDTEKINCICLTTDDGKIHCYDGPAVYFPNGSYEFWIHDTWIESTQVLLVNSMRYKPVPLLLVSRNVAKPVSSIMLQGL